MKYLYVGLFLTALLVISSCAVDKGELNPPVSEDFCDSVSVTYDNRMKELVDLNCATANCHVSGFGSGDFSSYASLQASGAFNGEPSRIVARAIDENPSVMPPPSFGVMPDSVKALFQCWADAGFPQQ